MRVRLLLIGLLALAACGSSGEGPEDGVDLEGPASFLTLELATFDDGETFQLADLAGRPVVVNFFASWCVPCVREMPDLERVKQELGDQVAFVGINVQDSAEAGRDLIEETGITWQVARDPDGEAVLAAGVRGMPTTLLLDVDGSVVEHRTGALDDGELRDLLAEHFDIRVETPS